MLRRVVIDSGPLLALFDRDDRFHARAIEFLRPFRGELLTTLAVITEVVYLLDFSVTAQTDFLAWIHAGGLSVVHVPGEEVKRAAELMKQYADRPMDFADSTLVVVCERLRIRDIASVDEDFLVYRLPGKLTFRNVFLS